MYKREREINKMMMIKESTEDENEYKVANGYKNIDSHPKLNFHSNIEDYYFIFCF